MCINKETYIDLDVSFILSLLKKITDRSHEIKLIEFYSYNVRNRNSYKEFKEYLNKNNLSYKDKNLLKYSIKILNTLDSLIFENSDFDFCNAEFKEWIKMSKDEIKARFVVRS